MTHNTAGLVLDTETTSFNGEILEIASVAVDNNGVMVAPPLSHIVAPVGSISFGSMGVHGITPEMASGQPVLATIINQHAPPTDGYLIAHNAKFDVGMLPEGWLPESVKVLCTMELAKKLFDKYEYGDYKNTTLWYGMGFYKAAQYTGVPHRAGYDAQMTADVLAFMLDKYKLTLDTAYDLLHEPPPPVQETDCWMKKYRGAGVTWEQLVDIDRDYVEWLVANFSWKEEHKELLAFLTDAVAEQEVLSPAVAMLDGGLYDEMECGYDLRDD